MFQIGLNPYGLTYTLGLQGVGTPRANPNGVGMDGFIDLARAIGARCLELDGRWLAPLGPADLARAADRVAALDVPVIYSGWLMQTTGETLADHIRVARAIGAGLIRLHLSPVLEGARARWGADWTRFVAHARTTLARDAPKAADAGLAIAIEDHQDFGSEELLAMAGEAGPNVGIVFDTGNPFAVGEDPVAFATRVGARVRHVHLKDYRAQFTDEGYRLVRCAIGDGCAPLAEIADALGAAGADTAALTASIEPGALEARHIRAFAADWWRGYPARDAREFATMLGRLRLRRLGDDEDVRTPWERRAPPEAIVEYERAQLRQSAAYLCGLGWVQVKRTHESEER